MKFLARVAVLGAVAFATVAVVRGAGDAEGGASTAYVAPADGPVTSGFGARWGSTHYGLDIGAPLGAPIHAVARGTVVEAGPATGFGNWVRIRHPSGDITVYGHMATYTVTTGQRVDTGQRIAAVGSEGQSTGPHLHFEVWPGGSRANRVDPRPWLAAHGVHL